MANLGRMLGMLLATRMAGRGRYGSALGTTALLGGGRMGRMAGLAGLGYMAYRAFQNSRASPPENQRTAAAGSGQPDGGSSRAQQGGIMGAVGSLLDSLTGGQMDSRRDKPGMGDAVGSYHDPASAAPDGAMGGDAAPPTEADQIDDDRALLLIRAMIAAANADGVISADERQRIIAQVDAAGGDADDHRIIEQELANPKPLDTLLAEVDDHDTAQQFYAASRAAMDGQTATQTSYLDYLRNRLGLPDDEAAEIDQAMQ